MSRANAAVGRMTENAFECALRALRYRDRTGFEIEEHLRARGFPDEDRSRAVETLCRTGLIDDQRFARARASSLAQRGAGNALIRARLAEAGLARELVDDALDAMEPEATRAHRIVARRGASPKTGRYLYGKGFSEGVVRSVIAEGGADELG